jgi:dihydropteroate synthase
MARGSISLDGPVVVGVLNVTPDSFSDGGRFVKPGGALRHAEVLLREGATVIDVGGESTRPGRPDPVPLEDEWKRLEPVLSRWSHALGDVPLSVDTVKAEVARRSLDLGAWIINDVSGFRHDPAMSQICAQGGCGVVLMHSRGSMSEMATYDHAAYRDVVAEVLAETEAGVSRALSAGVGREAIVIDPGLGFSKRPEHNWALINRLSAFASLGFPIMVGPSRKRFVRAVVSDDEASLDAATAVVCAASYAAGASLFRVHGVKPTAAALRIIQAVRSH